MKVAIAPNAFKGSATSLEVANWLANGIQIINPSIEIKIIPIGDGGDGTLASIKQVGYRTEKVKVIGPENSEVLAEIGFKNDEAFIELAEAAGLKKIKSGKLFPLTASTYGVGQLIKFALDCGSRKISIAIGGSASTDAGAGALQALGGKLLDSNGAELNLGGGELAKLASIDLKQLDERIAKTTFTIATDVENPLLGEQGAARIFGAQKGANGAEISQLESSLINFSKIAGRKFIDATGSGAAGGFGYFGLTFLNAKLVSGIDLILNLLDFETQIQDADLVITGEGKFDSQSLAGKGPIGIAKICSVKGIPIILVCGVKESNSESFKQIYQIMDFAPNLKSAQENPKLWIEKIGSEIAISHLI